MKLIIFITLFTYAFGAFASECLNHDEQQEHRENIYTLISESASCESDVDCKLVYLGCPFGCGTAINIGREQEVTSAVTGYHAQSCSQCMYKCMHRSSTECINNKCVAK